MTADLLRVADVEKMLGLSRTTVYALAADGVLKKAYIGKGTRNFRITVESIEAYRKSLSQDPIEVDA